MANAYRLNGTLFTLQPTSGKWLPRVMLGTDGNGHPIYSALRDFQLNWNLISPSDYNQLLNFYLAVGTTGSAVANLPQYNSASYTFYSYSGCAVQEPEINEYWSEHIVNATMIISGIRA